MAAGPGALSMGPRHRIDMKHERSMSATLRCYAMKLATSEGKTAKSALKLGTAGGRAFGVPASAKQP